MSPLGVQGRGIATPAELLALRRWAQRTHAPLSERAEIARSVLQDLLTVLDLRVAGLDSCPDCGRAFFVDAHDQRSGWNSPERVELPTGPAPEPGVPS